MRITIDAPQSLPPYRPWQSQEIEATYDRMRHAIFAAPRTGKTRVAAELAKGYLDRLEEPRLIIVCPIKVAVAWAEMLRDVGIGPVMHAYDGSVAEVAEKLRTFKSGAIVINQDRIARHVSKSKYSKKLWELLVWWRPHAYIRDESHRDKDPQSQMGKASRRIAKAAAWVRILTGTPSPNHYGDLWGQLVMINEDAFFPRHAEFRGRYLVCDSMFPSRVLAHINVPELQTKLLQNASFWTRERVFGPDSWTTNERLVELAPKTRAQYEKLAKEWILEIENQGQVPPEFLTLLREHGVEGLQVGKQSFSTASGGSSEVLADHVLKRMTRLQQFTSGYLPDELGNVHEMHTEKLDAALSDLSEIFAGGDKAVVFHRFRWEGRMLYQRIKAEYRKVKVYEINGDTTPADVHRIQAEFASCKEPAVVIGQTQAAGLGISLAEASYALFLSQTFSFTDEEQARDRIYKPGCARIVTYYRVADSIDEFIADVIDNKEKIHQAVTKADRQVMCYGRLANSRKKIA